jgi:hypothetical protein
MSISVNAQTRFSKPISSQIDTTFKDRPNFGPEGFIYLDRIIINLTPTLKEYKNVKAKINELPKDHIKYIDSIDYYFSPNDILNVRIYSHNYAYHSTNTYKLGKGKGSLEEHLVLNKVFDIDVQMKSEVEDIEKYRNDQFAFEILEGKIQGNKGKQRFIINKNYR